MKQEKRKALPILLADDVGSEPGLEKRSKALRDWVGYLAGKLGSSVELLYVEDPQLYALKPYYKSLIEAHLTKKRSLLDRAREFFEVPTRVLFLKGDPTQKILSLCSKRSNYEWVAMGTHGRTGLSRAILGSVAEEVIRSSKVPVLTLGPRGQEKGGKIPPGSHLKILVPTALTANSIPAEEYACGLAARLGAELVLFHSLHETLHPVLQTAFAVPGASLDVSEFFESLAKDAQRRLQAKARKFGEKGITVSVSMDRRPVSSTDSVLAEAQKRDASLIVMGTHGRNLVTGAFFGRTVRGVILEAGVPVITVRSKKQ